MGSNIDDLLAGYPHLAEAWEGFWVAYVRECEMGTFAPITLLGDGYQLLQSDRDVDDERSSLELADDSQFYMVFREEGVTREVWGFDGYSYNAEACLLFRNFDRGYEYCEGYEPGGEWR